MQPTIFPSDSPTLSAGAETARLAGRIVSASKRTVTLADALAQVLLSHDGLEFQTGALVVVEARALETGWHVARVIETHRPPRATSNGEFARLGGGRGAALSARSRAASAIRRYFEDEGFIEVTTPTFVPSPGLDPHVHSLAEVRRGERVDHLITSPEFHMKRLLVGGLPRIYQFARCFRAEELGPHHEPEFTLLEWYRAFSSYHEMLRDTEELVCRVLSTVDPGAPLPLRPFRRLPVRDAFARFAPGRDPSELLAQDPADYYQVFVDVVEPGLVDLDGPTFLTEFPLPLAALARRSSTNPNVAERFELYFRGQEICNGYGELTDPAEQRARFESELKRRDLAREPSYPIDERLLSALEEGMPPSSGNALGFDRLVALACGLAKIGPTYAFCDNER